MIKKARNCHTKVAWEALFRTYGETIATTSTAKPIQDLYRLLIADPQSSQYAPQIWAALISGALSSWDLGLAKEITGGLKNPSPTITIPAAKTYLECGHPSRARSIALRSLRLTNIPAAEKLQLDMIVARSYVEEGKRQKSIRLLARFRTKMTSTTLAPKQRAELLSDLGRMQYFLGRYSQAREYFHEASNIFTSLSEWEAAAKAIFNTASCCLNSGKFSRANAFDLIEKCRSLSAEHTLRGPLSYCEAVYGMTAYERGRFGEALTHLRKALELLPPNDQSFRRLHLLSALSHTYLAMGQFHMAKQMGKQVLIPKVRGEPTKAHSQYLALKAELLWEEGAIDQSQTILHEFGLNLERRGVHTLDDMAALSRLHLQSATLDHREELVKVDISETLRNNPSATLTHNFSLAHLALNRGAFEDATDLFQRCQEMAKVHDDRYHLALSTLGCIQIHLRRRQVHLVEPLLEKLEQAIALLGDSPLRTQFQFALAGSYYQRGLFNDCKKVLRGAQKIGRQTYSDRFVLQGWLATIEGKSFRMTHPWQKKMLARYTKLFFSPCLEPVDFNNFIISNHYSVSLDRNPALATLLQHLLRKGSLSASAEDIQTQVWKQSLHLQGWQQKIRNTIMRLRDFFPHTMAPLILHDDNIALFKDAVDFKRPRQGGAKGPPDIRQILTERPMSSQELARNLDISPATIKRMLKKMAEQHSVIMMKHGRHVLYKANPKNDLPFY